MLKYTLKLANGQEINLEYTMCRFWLDEDIRPLLTPENLKKITLSTDEKIITDFNDPNFTPDFVTPGDYEDQKYYDFTKRNGRWSFYLADAVL